MDEQKTTDSAAGRAGKPDAGFRAASFQQVNESGGGSGDAHPSIDVILDVPVTLSLEVGRAQMSVGHLLRLSQGSVVELDRSAGEPLDVLVNGALVAHGEIVVVNDKFGIRLTDVVSPPARQPQP
jgi:flagellar motor switch protein FliN/FliY